MMKEQDVLRVVEGLTITRLRICVEEEWIRPSQSLGAGDGDRVFDELDVARLRLISELLDDLAVNHDAVPIILSLIDQTHGLNRRIRAFQDVVSDLDEAVATKIALHLKAELGD